MAHLFVQDYLAHVSPEAAYSQTRRDSESLSCRIWEEDGGKQEVWVFTADWIYVDLAGTQEYGKGSHGGTHKGPGG